MTSEAGKETGRNPNHQVARVDRRRLHVNTAQQTTDKGSFDTCVGVFFSPVPTMRSIAHRRPIGWAVLIISVIFAAHGLVQAASLDSYDFDIEGLRGLYWALLLLVGPVIAIVGVAFFAAICWSVSRIFGGRGSYGGLFAGLGFAYLPAVFTVPISFIAIQLDSLGMGLSWVIGFGVGTWTIILSVFAVQASNDFSTGRSIAVVLISLAISLVVVFVLTVLLVLLRILMAFGWW